MIPLCFEGIVVPAAASLTTATMHMITVADAAGASILPSVTGLPPDWFIIEHKSQEIVASVILVVLLQS